MNIEDQERLKDLIDMALSKLHSLDIVLLEIYEYTKDETLKEFNKKNIELNDKLIDLDLMRIDQSSEFKDYIRRNKDE
jgi:hypothetical protein